MKYEDKMSAHQRFWVGPLEPLETIVYRMTAEAGSKMWYQVAGGIVLEPDHSEFTIRLHNPQFKTINYVNETIAVLPKHELKKIHQLIGEYLNDQHDPEEHTD